MSGAKVVGLLLVLLGVIALLYSGFTYTRRERVDLGPVEVEKKTTEHVPIPPLAGGLALLGGVVVILTARGAVGRRMG